MRRERHKNKFYVVFTFYVETNPKPDFITSPDFGVRNLSRAAQE